MRFAAWTEEMTAEAMRLYEAGVALHLVAEKLDVSQTTLRRRLEALSVARRAPIVHSRCKSPHEWATEHVQFVGERWKAGLSANEIAAALLREFQIHKSRNAVIGVIHRNGWSGLARGPVSKPRGTAGRSSHRSNINREAIAAAAQKAKAVAEERRKAQAAARAIVEPVQAPPEPRHVCEVVSPPEPAEPAMPGLRTVMTIAARGECRWPIGEPLSDDFAFCGRRTEEGPYCPHHAPLAWNPVQPKDRKPGQFVRTLRRYI